MTGVCSAGWSRTGLCGDASAPPGRDGASAGVGEKRGLVTPPCMAKLKPMVGLDERDPSPGDEAATPGSPAPQGQDGEKNQHPEENACPRPLRSDGPGQTPHAGTKQPQSTEICRFLTAGQGCCGRLHAQRRLGQDRGPRGTISRLCTHGVSTVYLR